MAKYIPSRNYIGSSEIATDLDVTWPATFANNITLTGSDIDTYIENANVKLFGNGDEFVLNYKAVEETYFTDDEIFPFYMILIIGKELKIKM